MANISLDYWIVLHGKARKSRHLSLGLTAKFRKEISEISSESETEPTQLRETLQKEVKDLARGEFLVSSMYFFGVSREIRQKAAAEIAKVSKDLSLEDLLEFARSPVPGERVGAAIGLRVKIQSFPSVSENKYERSPVDFQLTAAQLRRHRPPQSGAPAARASVALAVRGSWPPDLEIHDDRCRPGQGSGAGAYSHGNTAG